MSVLGIILALVVAVVGLIMEGVGGLVFGALVGYCLGAIIELTTLMGDFKKKLTYLENILHSFKKSRESEQTKPEIVKPVADEAEKPTSSPVPPATQPDQPVQPSKSMDTGSEPPKTLPPAKPKPTQPVQKHNVPRPAPVVQKSSIQQRLDSQEKEFKENFVDKLVAAVHKFFTDGNVVVKVGMLILIIGVGFLLKYAYDERLFVIPMELRFVGAGLLGFALIIFGWRLRAKKQVYALLLQGGGIGIMYLTVFGAAKFYSMIPIVMAFAVMVGLVVFSAILAILQNARQLAFFGAIGGFLAPVLLSTGGGSHVVLFSYYGLLNFGILGIAYYRSWRELNLLGFLFTFGIAGAWGADRYIDAYFASTEPFLIIFFLMYVAIAILFAFRQPPKLKGYIDSTLLFGVPIIVFGYQAAMVHTIEYGIAFSALCMSAFYIFLASTLWRRGPEGMRLLTESFLAMGVVFGSLAIPLALDGRWTSAAWAMEGAALIWVGVRQSRIMPRLFGILLQFGAGYFFLVDLLKSSTPIDSMMFLNSLYMGGAIISLAGLFSSYYLYKNKEAIRNFEVPFHVILFVWGLIWWFVAGLSEMEAHVSNRYLLNASFAFITLSLYIGYAIQFWTKWRMMRFPVLSHLYVMLGFLWIGVVVGADHPFADYGWIIWPVALLIQYWFLFRYSDEVGRIVMQWQHIMTFWLVILVASWESAWLINKAIDGAHSWRDVMLALTPAVLMLLLFTVGKHIRWPIKKYYKWYASHAATPVMVVLAIVALGFAIFHEGNPWPVQLFIPIFNPVDVAVFFLLYLLMLWRIQLERVDSTLARIINKRVFNYGMAAMGFMWINGMVARTIHHWFDVRHDLGSMLRADQFQGTISIIWTILALTIMVVASRRLKRHLWFVGLGLFIVVAAKLFLHDMGNANALTMAISITVVGIIAVVFGYYLSPLPPRKEESQL